ncbi:hypothetical protein MRB53_035954 [Persea americana]|uniref:Uncharacterized protein n=1 Tax=Persea americana TaxID=3435 RepID=A0ACC2K6G4_PERAE|nr:hypothetical protein MRB53_035954 [Persea americana]
MVMHGRDVVFLFLLAFCCFPAFGSVATLLPQEEVEALREISMTLGEENWNFSADPCSRESGWAGAAHTEEVENAVTCNCSYQNNTVCHVVSIILKGQNLQGVLPPELIKLPYLQKINLMSNYLNGTIPAAWGSMQLVKISLLGNRLTGPIPEELWNISTLRNLTLEANQFSGRLPQGLGKLVNIEHIHVSSNEFLGELPKSFANLKNLKDFRISDNRLTGRIPDFIQNWTELDRLEIQGTGLQGPIPSGISSLEKLTDLRISDINGAASAFPPLGNMKGMRTLILRNCNLTGPIPEYIWTMKNLKTLDLSFNMLVGEFPPTINQLENAKFIYLTSNLLNGTVPDGLLKRVLSSLHINCGGDEVALTINETHRKTTFKEDQDPAGASKYFSSKENWAFSNTGDFMDNNKEPDIYIASNISRLTMPDFDLYMKARISPLSLTYYGLCLWNGNYTVKLHFAEIRFKEGRTYKSLGKRIFDVYIQGKLVLKDFNIEDEAGGTHRAVVKNFTAIVKTNTLEIRFYWSGKGTQSIPQSGTYGPLISAISVDADFTPPGAKKISIGAVIGVVASVLCVILLILGILCGKVCLDKKRTIGYMAPEYAMHGYLTGKADVYSFGVVTLEIVSGKNATSFRPNGDHIHLVDWAYVLQAKGNLMELVDLKLGPEFNKEEATRMINVALLCTNSSPTLRPTMSAVVRMLEGQAVIEEVVSNPSFSTGNLNFKANIYQYGQVQTQSPSPSQSLITSVDQPWTATRPASSEKREATAAVVVGNGRKSRRSITVNHPPSIPARSPSPLFRRRAVVAASQSGYPPVVAAEDEEGDWAIVSVLKQRQ